MRKRAFTLIEVIISIVLISLIVIYLLSAVGTLQKSNNAFFQHYQTLSHTMKIHQTFLHDLSQSLLVNVAPSQPFDRVILETKSSHFNIPQPYVSYLVKNNRLYRIESPFSLKQPFNDVQLRGVKYEVMAENVSYFKLFVSSQDRFLVALNEMVFEIVK